MWKQQELDRPYMRFFLLEWNFLTDNLLPIIFTQGEDKMLLSECIRLLWVFSAEYSYEDLDEFEYRDEFLAKRDTLKSLLYNKRFMNRMVSEIEICASAGEHILESQKRMLKFIVGILLNLLQLNIKPILSKFIPVFNTNGGFLDSLIYLTQNSNVEAFQPLFFDLSKIVHILTSIVTPKALFGDAYEKDPEFRKRIDMQRIIQSRRKKNVISSRHSRFGAMISVRREDNTTALLSNPNALKDKDYMRSLHWREGQLRKRVFGAYQQRILDKKLHPQMAKIKQAKAIDPMVISHLRRFFREFFDYGFANMVNCLTESMLNSSDSENFLAENENLFFIQLITFVLESALIMKYFQLSLSS